MLILGAVGLQIRLSDCSMFRSTSGRLQSKNVPLDLWSLAKQESFFLQRYNKRDGPI